MIELKHMAWKDGERYYYHCRCDNTTAKYGHGIPLKRCQICKEEFVRFDLGFIGEPDISTKIQFEG